MKAALFLPLLAAAATAQLLTNGIGSLPSCAQNCPILNNAQSQCNGGSSTSLSVWSCFCQNVYTASGQNTAAICPSTCSAGTDEAEVTSWFTANCGSDNGASEHGGSGGTATTSSAGSSATSGSSSSGSSSNDGVTEPGSNGCSGSWWHCHYQYIVMIIVVAVGLVALGFGGRWLKKRHDRKRDQISEGFNSGITSRSAYYDDKAPNARSGAAARDTSARTRDAFMPYGYNYSRSESSRLDRQKDAPNNPSASRDVEKGEGGAKEKLKRVLVRDKSGAGL